MDPPEQLRGTVVGGGTWRCSCPNFDPAPSIDDLIREAEEAERKERAALIAQGVDPVDLDRMEEEMRADMAREPTPEERLLFERIMRP